jgi:hypothetical protein
MAKVKITGHASGSGVITVTAPNTSTDRTVTLPDSTGTILDENSSLPAANLTGTVATARLGSGTASSGTILYGDQTYKTAPTSFNPDAAVVFNQSGADVDFRVEADNDEYALFVNGEQGNVGVGNTATQGEFSVTTGGSNGSGHTTGIQVRQNGYSGYKSGMTAGDTAATTHSCGFIGFLGGGHTGAGERSIIFETRPGTTDAAPTKRMIIADTGNVAVAGTDGTYDMSGQFNVKSTSGNAPISLWNTHQNSTQIAFHNTAGSLIGKIHNDASSTTYATSSDYRLKENVDYTWDATTRLKQLKPARFNFIIDDTNTLVDGFLAHETATVVPEAIVGTKDETEIINNVVLNADGSINQQNVTESKWTQGKIDEVYLANTTWVATKTVPKYQSIDQSKLVPLLVKTIQELEARITALEA